MEQLTISGSYTDLRRLRTNPPETHVAYDSQKCYREFLGLIEQVGEKAGVHRYRHVFQKLIEKKKLIIFFTKDDKPFSFGAVYVPLLDVVYVPFNVYVHNKYQLEIISMISTTCHELAHMMYHHKTQTAIQTFRPLLQLFYKMSFLTYLKRSGVSITASITSNVDTMVSRFFVTSDSGFEVLLSENFIEFLEQKHFTEDVKKKILRLTHVITYLHNIEKVKQDNELKKEFRELIDVMVDVHCKLSRITRADYNKAQAGIPAQELSFPSEVISIQSQLNPLVRGKVLQIVNTFV